MSGHASSPAKVSRRRKLFDSISSRLSLPSAVQTQLSQVSNVPAIQATPPVPVQSTVPLNLTPPPDPASQATTQSITGAHLLENALQRLLHRDRQVLSKHFSQHQSDVDQALADALMAAKHKQRAYLDEKWTFILAGRTVRLQEEADKILNWLVRFKSVGNVVANVDPAHVGLPWTGIRLLLDVVTSEHSQMATIAIGCQTVLYMANRLKAYVEFLQRLPAMPTRDNLEVAVTELYAHILSFLAQAIQVYETPTIRRIFSAIWTIADVEDFERKCDQLAVRAEIEASSCDRAVIAQDRGSVLQIHQDLIRVLAELRQYHQLQMSMDRIEMKLDLGKIPCATGAVFNSSDNNHVSCHPETRRDLIHEIEAWISKPDGKSIYWLNGSAGTGKSTISYTVAQLVAEQGGRGSLSDIDLGASFFFKRGEGDRGSSTYLFPTLLRQLVLKVPGLSDLIAEVINLDPLIFGKALGEQFRKLIFEPLRTLSNQNTASPTLVVVVDALDECDKEDDIATILKLWSNLSEVQGLSLRLFLTSRPDLPIHLGFLEMSNDRYQNIILQDAVPKHTIEHDLTVYLKDEFHTLRNKHNLRSYPEHSISEDWPGDDILQCLVNMAVPLFIVAATVYRYVSDANFDPRERLEEVLNHQKIGQMSQMELTYSSVLRYLTVKDRSARDQQKLQQEFQTVVGSLVCLAEPLSIKDLATLLGLSTKLVELRLNPLRSVLRMPEDLETPVRTLHLSFAEFLLNNDLQEERYKVNGPSTHLILMRYCLRLLFSPAGLRENICNLTSPGQLRTEIDSNLVARCLPSVIQYACRYWTHHAQFIVSPAQVLEEIYTFLREHFLCWLEALSLMSRASEAIGLVNRLQSMVNRNSANSPLSSFLEDARRFVLANQFMMNIAPLQLYSSGILFAPQESLVRTFCGQVPKWIGRHPAIPVAWSSELQKLEGHVGLVGAVAFSHDGSLLASASYDETVQLWDPGTGRELQKLQGHHEGVGSVTFSHNSLLLASASWDKTVRLWDSKTGEEILKLKHNSGVNAVVFSHDSSLLASSSFDGIVRVWNTKMGEAVQELEGHTGYVSALAFPHDSSLLASGSDDQTVRIWDPKTGEEILKLKHSSGVSAVVFSHDSSFLASSSFDEAVRLSDLKTGEVIRELKESINRDTTAIALSHDSSLLAAASSDYVVRLWDPRTGEQVRKLEGHCGWVNSVAFSHDGSLLASASNDMTVRLWDPLKSREAQKLKGHSARVLYVAASHDGSLLASASKDRTIRLWNPRTGGEVLELVGHTGWVTAVVFSNDSSLLASASHDNTVRLWNRRTGEEIRKFEGKSDFTNVIALSPDNSVVALVDLYNSRVVRLWNSKMGEQIGQLEAHDDVVIAIAFSHDSLLLASASLDQTVRLWDLKTGIEVQRFEAMLNTNYIRFSIDDSMLISDRGCLKIDGSSSAWTPEPTDSIMLLDQWIQHGDRKLLWLPHEYRGKSVFIDGVLAVGQNSGQVSFWQIDLELLSDSVSGSTQKLDE